MATEQDFDRWAQKRELNQRTASAKNSTTRLRNSSRSMIFDRKEYTGGPLREGVSDRRSEWMGGGMGGRMGEDWRDIAPTTVQRQGSGLDPISAAVVNKFKQRSQKKQMARRGFNMPAETEAGPVVEEEKPTYNTAPLLPGDPNEVGPETARWNAAFPAMRDRIASNVGARGATPLTPPP